MFLDHSTKGKKGIFHKRIYLSFILLHKYSYIHLYYLILYYQIYLHVYKYTHTHTHIYIYRERECIYANYLNSRSLTIWKSFLKLSDICPVYTKIYIYLYIHIYIHVSLKNDILVILTRSKRLQVPCF